ncbi:GTP-binding protein EngB [bioreactor metagenome]|uniref:GTP-binding protein EngB n=1 Tax=bioreactor metagenome TaxID=1076179 RepID=A0A645FF47_9ZZZZ
METDLKLIEFLKNINKKYLIILTKCDKLSANAVQDRKMQVEHIVSLCNNCVEVLPYSSITNFKRTELIGIIKKHTSQ